MDIISILLIFVTALAVAEGVGCYLVRRTGRDEYHVAPLICIAVASLVALVTMS